MMFSSIFFFGGDTLTCCFIEILPKCFTVLNLMTVMLCCVNMYILARYSNCACAGFVYKRSQCFLIDYFFAGRRERRAKKILMWSRASPADSSTIPRSLFKNIFPIDPKDVWLQRYRLPQKQWILGWHRDFGRRLYFVTFWVILFS